MPATELALDMGCIEGDAEIVVCRGGATKRLTLRRAHRLFSEGNWTNKWHCRSLKGDVFGQHGIRDIVFSGVRPVIRILLDNGKTIRCTPDHEIGQPGGKWSEASSLEPGDEVLCNGARVKKGKVVACHGCGTEMYLFPSAIKRGRKGCWDCHLKRMRLTGEDNPNWKGGRFIDSDGYVRIHLPSHPRANPAGQVYEHIVIMEKVLGRSISRAEHTHHVNEIKHDNRPENLEIISPELHNRHHEAFKRLDGGSTINGGRVVLIPKTAKVVSVEDAGETDVYDIVMDDPHRNFVANGIVVHNCGKSCVVVDLVVNRNHKRTLIAAPLSVIQEWPNQFRQWAGKPISVCPLDDKIGSVKDKVNQAKIAIMQAEAEGLPVVIVANYETIWRPPFGPIYNEPGTKIVDQGWAMQAGFDLVVCDEIHRISSHKSKASKFIGKLGRTVPYRLGLTGTPFSSGPLSVFGQYRFLDPGIFGERFDEFRQRYANMGGYGNYQVKGYANEDELRSKFYSIAFRVESRDVLDLPDEMHIRRTFRLGDKGRASYKQLERDFIAEFKEGRITVTNALTKLLRLQQMTSGFGRLDATDQEEGQTIRVDHEKQKLLEDILEDIDPSEPIVIFARFIHDLEVIREACAKKGRSYMELSGRIKQTTEWKAGGATVLGVQLRAGGVGVDLTRSHYCIYYSMGYSLADYSQSLARTMRPGQHFNVSYIHLMAEGTVDEKVYAALDAKQEVVQSILGGIR